ncbi:hypothetical protein HMPREF3197_05256 [Klebsiella pneumoniae]|nr:hypothetical protein HMPREF3197_05256 [Klebsiella pneumoniae]
MPTHTLNTIFNIASRRENDTERQEGVNGRYAFKLAWDFVRSWGKVEEQKCASP